MNYQFTYRLFLNYAIVNMKYSCLEMKNTSISTIKLFHIFTLYIKHWGYSAVGQKCFGLYEIIWIRGPTISTSITYTASSSSKSMMSHSLLCSCSKAMLILCCQSVWHQPWTLTTTTKTYCFTCSLHNITVPIHQPHCASISAAVRWQAHPELIPVQDSLKLASLQLAEMTRTEHALLKNQKITQWLGDFWPKLILSLKSEKLFDKRNGQSKTLYYFNSK